MTRKGLHIIGLDKLEATLDTYGADRTRWPAPVRHMLSGLIAGNPEAQKLLKDAEAFDRLLDKAPRYDAVRLDKLRERIAAAAARQPRLISTRSHQAAAGPALRRQHGLVATALAASLVLGIFAGQSSVVSRTADTILGGDGSSYASNGRQMAQTDEAGSLLDGDLL
jgi:hypothetical protein